ncbi:MAG: nicotinate-nucleotide adenylyltransferase [Ignavibacteriae bacterium]|nr:nicotinate-nucleotide adenylyltransferase [Ignavibacteriota bacterium]
MKRFGIYGGTFNPPHLGHLIVTESVQDQLQFDNVLFIPAAIPPHKIESQIAPVRARLEMTALAISKNRSFEVSDIEITRTGFSYTIDTVNQLKELYPHTNFSLIIGADNFLEIESWKSPEKILEQVELIVMNRFGFEPALMNSKFMKEARFVTVPNIGISSTEIRRLVKQERSIRYLVPPEVEQYIYVNGLYRT